MVATSVNVHRGIDALSRVRELVEEHGTNEQRERLSRIMGGAIPAPNRAPVEHAVYTSEALAILFEIVGELKEASKPKRRGRPPKDRTQEAS